jgi:hypothetical protein
MENDPEIYGVIFLLPRAQASSYRQSRNTGLIKKAQKREIEAS